ncbi:MAG: phosphatidate cytidylyltransferase, partial [Actinomycetales bacterium]|nr:phosphatidate cytidylyltransferase [Actinomycetales bacterium]
MTDSERNGVERINQRAGRNVPAATAIGVGLLAGVLLLIWYVPWGLVALLTVASVLGLREMGRALALQHVRLVAVPVYLAAATMPALAYKFGLPAMIVAYTLCVLSVFGWRMVRGNDGFVRDVAANTFLIAYVPLLISFVALALAHADGHKRITIFLLLNVASDTGGWLAGVMAGKHPMAPSISPKKTWEGLAGSLAAAAALGGYLLPALLDAQWWKGVLLGLVLAFVATYGDLSESLLKRDLGIKDMSHAI